MLHWLIFCLCEGWGIQSLTTSYNAFMCLVACPSFKFFVYFPNSSISTTPVKVIIMIIIILIGCLHGQLRLVNGSIPNAGRLEICIMDQWGTICNDGWTHDNAEVACRQLGYSTDGKNCMAH